MEFRNLVSYALAITALVGLVRHILTRRRLSPGLKWLPGPRGIPLIGRVWDIPREHTYKRFKAWSDQYGPIFTINIFGTTHIWLSSNEIAHDILSKRGNLHQARPSINQLEDSKGAAEYLPLLGHNESWARQRKMVTQFMTNTAKANHYDIPFLETPQMLVELFDNNSNYYNIIENYTGRVISRLAFGVPDHYAEIRKQSHGLLNAISPVEYITNIIPQLKILPTYLSPWKLIEKRRHAEERKFFMHLQNGVASRMEDGTAQPSYMRQTLEKKTAAGISDVECSYIVGMVGLAGVLTTASGLMNYVLAMTLYPQWQQRLQDEIETVCGDRMPQISNSPRMPVLRAIIIELLRWRPITPSGIPHEATEDDVYDGYFIPKGAYIHPNQWALSRDTSVYPDPEVFNPDRWLNPKYPSYKEPLSVYPSIRGYISFGYGRRLCLGMELVENEFFVAMGGLAWAANVSSGVDENGRKMAVPEHDFTSHLISRPRSFPFELRVRSEERRGQVMEWYLEAGEKLAAM